MSEIVEHYQSCWRCRRDTFTESNLEIYGVRDGRLSRSTMAGISMLTCLYCNAKHIRSQGLPISEGGPRLFRFGSEESVAVMSKSRELSTSPESRGWRPANGDASGSAGGSVRNAPGCQDGTPWEPLAEAPASAPSA